MVLTGEKIQCQAKYMFELLTTQDSGLNMFLIDKSLEKSNERPLLQFSNLNKHAIH